MNKPSRLFQPRVSRGFCVFAVAGAAAFSSALQAFPVQSGGATSVRKADINAFSLPSNNMSFERKVDFSVGNSFFRNPWVIAPSSTSARDGLGPLFNTNGCQNCHIKDGRGHLPAAGDVNAVSMLVRISVAPQTPQQWQQVQTQGAIADPRYGTQIQDFAIPGVEPEAQLQFAYETHEMTLAEGTRVTLSKPVVTLAKLAYGPLDANLQTSLRLAPPMIGLGLLEAVPDSTLQAFADENDANGDGISGRLNRVHDAHTGGEAIGRFGWKAEQPSLQQQNAAAFAGDIGITSSLVPHTDCTPAQTACRYAPDGGTPEASDKIIRLVTFYSRNLAVPIRRNADAPDVKKGEQLFVSAGCESCHRTGMVTATLPEQPEQSAQTIYPYTDLLLHDMGEGLADGRPVYQASGREWRTAPLWGIGLTATVSGAEHYLHDGRARSLLEAILWHGGEAEAAREKVRQMPADEREALLAFLQSL